MINNNIYCEIQNQLMEIIQKQLIEIKLRSFEKDLCLVQQITENNFSLFSQIRKQKYDNKIKEKEEKKRLKELDDLHDFIRRKKREKK